MKILLITCYFPPKVGGAEGYLYNIYKRLQSNKVVVLANGEQTEFDKNQKFKINRCHFFSGWSKPRWWHLVKKVKKILKKEKIELIHFGHYAHFILLARILKMPYLVYTHGTDIPSYTKSWLGKRLTISNLKKAKKIIATSHYLKSQVTNLGISENKVEVVHPALDLEEYNFTALFEGGQTFARLQNDNKKIILSIGHLTPVKGFDIAIKAMPEILKQIPETIYIIVGDGEEKENLKNLVRQLNLKNKVIFTGEIKDKKELSKYYARANVYLGPSRREGFGIVFLEARAFGLPIVAFDVGGIKEAAGDKAILIEPGNTQSLVQNIIKILKENKKYEPEKNLGWKNKNDKCQMINEKISVIIPTYNSSQTLTNCLDHIFNQTYKNIQVIVVNDGSTDNTLDVLTKYKNRTQYSINIIHQENQGAPQARNRGFAESTGEYIIFVDSDVYLKPDCLEKMYQTLQTHTDAAYTYCSFKWGFKKFKLWTFDADKLKQMPYIHTTSLIRRNCYPNTGFDPALKRFQDWDLWLTLLKNGHHGIWLPKVLFTTSTKKNTMSTWVPAFIINHFPWLAKNKVKEYNQAKQIILKKHHLVEM